MAIYKIEPDRSTLHGVFSRDIAPVLTIDPGDSVQFRTLDAGWGLESRPSPGAARKRFEPMNPERDRGHAMCGPIHIRGAEPGMVLGVQINEIQPGAFGWTAAGGWKSWQNEKLGIVELEERHFDWALDVETMTARSQFGTFPYQIKMRPFMGILGMPPAESGNHSSVPPRFCGGNIDCKELVVGSTLYLPIAVPGGLFSTGDGHAVQGDGEVAGPAIECPMERVDLTFTLHTDMHLKMPRAHTPAGWVTLGFHEDLNEATVQALDGILQLMHDLYGIERREAVALASLVVDLHISQIVNGVKGVHAILPHDAIGNI